MSSSGNISTSQTAAAEAAASAAPAVTPTASAFTLITRAKVPVGLKYTEYKPYLRKDFFHSCAYCTSTESEALAIRFTIDHYVPQNADSQLVNEYTNLMYACDECNQRKGDRHPPPAAQTAGYRFFRPDMDMFSDHFRLGLSGIIINAESKTGDYTIEALDLNRHMLKRIRDLRQRLTECDKFVAEGILALRENCIDKIPPNVRAKVVKAIQDATRLAGKFADEIDELLQNHAKSELIDEDTKSEERLKERKARLKSMESLYPGSWRAPRKKKAHRK